jgi:hypothetical protein
MASSEAAARDLASIAEPNAFIVDDVAFIPPAHGFAIGREIERRGIHKRYYLETRADVLCRNPDVFAYWQRLGLEYLFLGLEAIDEEGLGLHRKRSSPGTNFEALEVARRIGVDTAVNLIVDPDWDERRFAVVREWALSIPEIVHLTVSTPYPGTETWLTESRKLATLDYRLVDIQHAVLRHPARRTADPPPLAKVLRGAGGDPARPRPQASRSRGAARRGRVDVPLAAQGADQLHPLGLEVRQGLQRRSAACRSRAGGPLRDPAAGGGQARRARLNAVCPCPVPGASGGPADVGLDLKHNPVSWNHPRRHTRARQRRRGCPIAPSEGRPPAGRRC